MYKQDIMEDFRKNAIDYKLLKKRVKIHSTAIVSSNAKIGDGSTIGAFSVIGDNVVIGNNCEIKSNVVIEGYTTIGDNNKIFPFAVTTSSGSSKNSNILSAAATIACNILDI